MRRQKISQNKHRVYMKKRIAKTRSRAQNAGFFYLLGTLAVTALTASVISLSKAFSALETAKQANTVLKGLGVTVTQLQGMLLGFGKYALIIAGISATIYGAYKAYKYFLPSHFCVQISSISSILSFEPEKATVNSS